MILAAIIENELDNEILLCRETLSNGTEMWSLPYCTTKKEKSAGQADLIKKCSEFNVSIEIQPSDVFCEYSINGEACVTFRSSLCSWTFSPSTDNSVVWIKTADIKSLCFDNRFNDVIDKLKAEYKRLDDVHNLLRKVVDDRSGLFDLNAEVKEEKSAIKVFVRYSCDIYCPFIFELDFGFENDNRVRFINTIHVARMIADGDKTDLYVLFSNCMAIIQKLFCSKKAYIDYMCLFDEVEVNAASIILMHSHKSLLVEEIEETFEKIYIEFIMSLFTFGNIFGSFITKLDESKYIKEYQQYLCNEVNNYNCQSRKELQYYCNSDIGISLLCVDNSEYRYDVLSGLTWDIIDGIDGKILCQINTDNGYLSFNFVSNERWDKINRVIKDMNINKYTFLCQDNALYMFEGKNIWMFDGDFSEYWVTEEKGKLLDRQNRENLILRFDRDFKWRYPIDFGRFEEMMADLYEAVNPTDDVRLVGRPNCPDGGRDILIWKRERKGEASFYKRLIIGQCKAYKRSISKSNVTDIRDMIDFYDASGFFLFVSSTLTANLVDHLVKLNEKFSVCWWTEREIFKKLRQHSNIADRYTDILDIVEIHSLNVNEKGVSAK